MIKTEIKAKLNFPKEFITQNDLRVISERILIPAMQQGIHAGAAIDGGMLPQNEPETILRKGDNRPLIETGTLLASFIAKDKGKYGVMVTLGNERKDIGKYLQIDGIKTKTGVKYYKFFGISKAAEVETLKYAAGIIKKAIENAGQRNS